MRRYRAQSVFKHRMLYRYNISAVFLAIMLLHATGISALAQEMSPMAGWDGSCLDFKTADTIARLESRISVLDQAMTQEARATREQFERTARLSSCLRERLDSVATTVNSRFEDLNASQSQLGIRYECIQNQEREIKRALTAVKDDLVMSGVWLESRLQAQMACGLCLGLGLFLLSLLYYCRRAPKALNGMVENKKPKGMVQPQSSMDLVSSTDSLFGRIGLRLGASLSSVSIPEMHTEIDRLIVEGASGPVRLNVTRSSDAWKSATCSIRGNSRPDNQDYALTFAIGDHSETPYQAIVIADGCGGADGGALASYLACATAARSLSTSLGCGIKDTISAARQAIADAGIVLAMAAARLPKTGADGLRTTLMVVIAQESHYAFAYIGDGGGMIIRHNNEVEKFLFPQKAAPGVYNTLSSSLGPFTLGEPIYGAIPHYTGDLLLCGTDGVFDAAGPRFPQAVAYELAGHKGGIERTCQTVLDQLTQAKDGKGEYIVTDNLTLGLIADQFRCSFKSPSSGTVSPKTSHTQAGEAPCSS